MNIAPTHLRCAGDFFVVAWAIVVNWAIMLCVVAWAIVVAWATMVWRGLPCYGRKREIFVPTPSDFSLVIEESRSSGKNEAILGVRCVNYAATPTKTSEKPKFDPNNKE